MTDSVAGCICHYPNASYPNRCDSCPHLELCRKSTPLNVKHAEKPSPLRMIEECLDIVQGGVSQ